MKKFRIVKHVGGGESFFKIQKFTWLGWTFIYEKEIFDLGMFFGGRLPLSFPSYEKAERWLTEKYSDETIRILPGFQEI